MVSITSSHQARMGADGDPMAALDARMRVRVIEGLRLADMSAVPDINAATPMLPPRCWATAAPVSFWERRKNAAPRHASEPFSGASRALRQGRPMRAFMFPVDAIACPAQMALGI
ncbi:GMC oxidoreductase [Sinorhizobium meliloti]|uniref:GMC oxidoreductase n=1 Tax=Rhizobium meliloti TaxID=382 RepID=UPI002D7761E5|nr:GMC oxidoreductase [Sinorhizobium meliloti]